MSELCYLPKHIIVYESVRLVLCHDLKGRSGLEPHLELTCIIWIHGRTTLPENKINTEQHEHRRTLTQDNNLYTRVNRVTFRRATTGRPFTWQYLTLQRYCTVTSVFANTESLDGVKFQEFELILLAVVSVCSVGSRSPVVLCVVQHLCPASVSSLRISHTHGTQCYQLLQNLHCLSPRLTV